MRIIKTGSKLSFLVLLVSTVLVFSEPAPRKEVSIPLVKLSLKKDKDDPQKLVVYIYSDDYQEHAEIGEINDRLVSNSKKGIHKTTFSEPLATAYTLSKFEHENLDDVISSLIKTLENLQSYLQKEEYPKCRYLDGYFPKFLKCFYKISVNAFNNKNALSKTADIPDSFFDVSLSSPKTDKRVAIWQEKNEHRLKLRISITELIFHLKKWEDDLEVDKAMNDAPVGYSNKFILAYELFIKMYFNTQISN